MTDASQSQTDPTAVADTDAPAPSRTPRVAGSFRHCHRVTRRCARNFYYGLKLTPEPRRSALYAIYALMRACDDLVDDDAPSEQDENAGERLARIAAFRQEMEQALAADDENGLPQDPLWPAVHHTIRTYRIDPFYFHQMLDGQQMDVKRSRYSTFEDLYGYCYRVASVVGLVCIDIWGHDGQRGVPKIAEYRGIAFQLTNILRDLVEDAQRDRLYLPEEEMTRFGVTLEQIRQRECTPGFERLMTYQIERARSYYAMSETLERHLSPECRATSWAMTQIYRRLLERIAHNPQAVLERRIGLGTLGKITIACRATLRRGRI